MNRTEFSRYVDIPLRTLEEWEAGRRQMPDIAAAKSEESRAADVVRKIERWVKVAQSSDLCYIYNTGTWEQTKTISII